MKPLTAFVVSLAAGLALALPAASVSSAPKSRTAPTAKPRDGYYFAAGRSQYGASVAGAKLVLLIFPAKCAAPGAALRPRLALAVSAAGSFSHSGGVSGGAGTAEISGRFVNPTTLVAKVSYRSPSGCVWQATVTYRWGGLTPLKAPPKSPTAKTKTSKESDESELECKSPQVAAFVSSSGAVLRYQFGDEAPAGARAVCWPSVRSYAGGWKQTFTQSAQNEWNSLSETKEAIGSGTLKVSYAEVTSQGAQAVYRGSADVFGTVSGTSSVSGVGCKWSGSGHVQGRSAITVRVGPPRKPRLTHQADLSGSDHKRSIQCTDGTAYTTDDPGLAGLTTAWTPMRSWQALAGSETTHGNGSFLTGSGLIPATYTTTWSFKAKS